MIECPRMSPSSSPIALSGWALVLGASSGFGEATSLALARAGLSVFGVHLDRRAPRRAPRPARGGRGGRGGGGGGGRGGGGRGRGGRGGGGGGGSGCHV